MLRRIYAVFLSRNREFLRDRASLSWNLLLPVALVFGLSFAFDGQRDEYTVGVLQVANSIDTSVHPFFETRYVRFVPYADIDEALRKVERHQLDLLVDPGPPARYWVNPDAAKGYFIEFALLQSVAEDTASIAKQQIRGDPVRYSDWILPGILGMNMMFSCLFGVGYVVVRYRKNGFLKRLQATPLRAVEFISAQVISRLILIIAVSVFVFAGTNYFVHFRMEGSYLTLLLVAVLGAICLISLGLLVAARVSSEEFAGGMLNMITWPMMLLSGVWFSMEGANPIMRQAAKLLPLTHILEAARAIMLDGAGLADIGDSLLVLVVMTALFVVSGTLLFRWRLE